jgi:NAD(P)-dependent dehydrogenase (short-subunit alcohol dehydrogenase family)
VPLKEKFMSIRNADRPVVVVTGGSRGIGRAVSLRAAEAGWNVALTYKSQEEEARATVAEIEAQGGHAAAFRADVGLQREVRHAFAGALQYFGRIDALVNNAGIGGIPRSISDMDESHLLDIFRTNVFGAFYCAGEAAKHMSTQTGGRGGVIVNVSSAAARHGGWAQESPYASSKGALDSFTLSLAKELAPQGIRVNAVRPGVIDTTIHECHGGEEAIRRVAPTIPLGRAGTAEEAAAVVLFLLSDQSSYVHGAIFDVSGGR